MEINLLERMCLKKDKLMIFVRDDLESIYLISYGFVYFLFVFKLSTKIQSLNDTFAFSKNTFHNY